MKFLLSQYLIFTLFFWPLPFSRDVYAFFLLFGTLMTAFAEMFFSAPLPTEVSFLLLIWMLFSLLSPENAFLPILETFVPIVTFSSFFIPLNAFAAIDVTLTFSPLIVTAAATFRVRAFLESTPYASASFFCASITRYFTFPDVTVSPTFSVSSGFGCS